MAYGHAGISHAYWLQDASKPAGGFDFEPGSRAPQALRISKLPYMPSTLNI